MLLLRPRSVSLHAYVRFEKYKMNTKVLLRANFFPSLISFPRGLLPLVTLPLDRFAKTSGYFLLTLPPLSTNEKHLPRPPRRANAKPLRKYCESGLFRKIFRLRFFGQLFPFPLPAVKPLGRMSERVIDFCPSVYFLQTGQFSWKPTLHLHPTRSMNGTHSVFLLSEWDTLSVRVASHHHEQSESERANETSSGQISSDK